MTNNLKLITSIIAIILLQACTASTTIMVQSSVSDHNQINDYMEGDYYDTDRDDDDNGGQVYYSKRIGNPKGDDTTYTESVNP